MKWGWNLQRSGLNRLKTELAGGFEELHVAGDKSPASGLPKAPDKCGGKLQGVRGAQDEPIRKLLSSFTDLRIGKNLAPFLTQGIEADQGGCLLIRSHLTHAEQPCKGASHFHWRGPPHDDVIGPIQASRCG